MLFLNIVALILLLVGPIVGYRIAVHGLAARPRRWRFMAYAGAGGAAAGLVMLELLDHADLLGFASLIDLVRHNLPFLGECTLFGVVLGAGFGGLTAARVLARSAVDIVLIDRNNHHLFQPLLYQVATAALAPSDIASPIRQILRGRRNVQARARAPWHHGLKGWSDCFCSTREPQLHPPASRRTMGC